jgi:hypothetical protein
VLGPVSLTVASATNDFVPSEFVTKIVPCTFPPTVSPCFAETWDTKNTIGNTIEQNIEMTRAFMIGRLND